MLNQHDESNFGGALFAAALLLCAASVPAIAQPDRGLPGERRAAPQRAAPQPAPTTRWLDKAHSHARYYPSTGVRIQALPARQPPLIWAGASYWFWSGVWYGPAASGYVVVRPPYGIAVADLPDFRTVVVIGGLTYSYLNGVYYRERSQGGYEVVPSPMAGVGTTTGAPGRLYVYPRQGQSAEVQASDEYECHRWAASQSGFDPVPAATGQSTDVTRRGDYVRAQTACLEGRGYTVR